MAQIFGDQRRLLRSVKLEVILAGQELLERVVSFSIRLGGLERAVVTAVDEHRHVDVFERLARECHGSAHGSTTVKHHILAGKLL